MSHNSCPGHERRRGWVLDLAARWWVSACRFIGEDRSQAAVWLYGGPARTGCRTFLQPAAHVTERLLLHTSYACLPLLDMRLDAALFVRSTAYLARPRAKFEAGAVLTKARSRASGIFPFFSSFSSFSRSLNGRKCRTTLRRRGRLDHFLPRASRKKEKREKRKKEEWRKTEKNGEIR